MTLPMEQSKSANALDVVATVALVVAAIFGAISLIILFIAGLFTHGWLTLGVTVVFASTLGYWAATRLHKSGKLGEYVEDIKNY